MCAVRLPCCLPAAVYAIGCVVLAAQVCAVFRGTGVCCTLVTTGPPPTSCQLGDMCTHVNGAANTQIAECVTGATADGLHGWAIACVVARVVTTTGPQDVALRWVKKTTRRGMLLIGRTCGVAMVGYCGVRRAKASLPRPRCHKVAGPVRAGWASRLNLSVSSGWWSWCEW